VAYMDQEKKSKIAAALKLAIPKTWKYSLGVRHHSTIVLTIASAPVDLIAEWNKNAKAQAEWKNEARLFSPADGYVQVNHFYLERAFDKHLSIFEAIRNALNLDNHDRSDITTDYHDVGHYLSINLGKWDKPFLVK